MSLSGGRHERYSPFSTRRAVTTGAAGRVVSAINPNQPGTSVWISAVPSASSVYAFNTLSERPAAVSFGSGFQVTPSVENAACNPATGFSRCTVNGAPKPSTGAWLSDSVTASVTAYPFGAGAGFGVNVTTTGAANAAAGQLAVARPSPEFTWPAGTGDGGGGGG